MLLDFLLYLFGVWICFMSLLCGCLFLVCCGCWFCLMDLLASVLWLLFDFDCCVLGGLAIVDCVWLYLCIVGWWVLSVACTYVVLIAMRCWVVMCEILIAYFDVRFCCFLYGLVLLWFVRFAWHFVDFCVFLRLQGDYGFVGNLIWFNLL